MDDATEALEIRNGVERVLDLGEYLVNYGEFVENNHALAPASYTVDWWTQEFADAGGPVQALRDSPSVNLEHPTADDALSWATEYDCPLHPAYTYLWHDVSVSAVAALIEALTESNLVSADGATEHPRPESIHTDSSLVIPRTETVTKTLETLLVEHTQQDDALVVETWQPLVRTLGFDTTLSQVRTMDDVSERATRYDDGENAIRVVNELAPFRVRERAPTRIGARMGRPEKSESRELSPAVHTLFPISEAGGNQRSIEDAATHGDTVQGTDGQVEVNVGRRECLDCGERGYHARCSCGGETRPVYLCPDCDREVEPDESGRAECPNCETLARPTEYQTVDIKSELRQAKEHVGERATAYKVLKGVKGLTSKEKVPEPLEKGILRAKHGVSAFKDGTVRYDMTDLPVTAVRPSELDVTVSHFRELGYETDIRGDPLEHDDQLVSLKVQDIVLSDGAAEHMLKTAEFVDSLLSQYYGLEPYYEFDERDDLVGELVFGMAPHTSAAVVGRIVGFTTAAVGYAHPYFHAAKRRNCDGDEDCVMLLLDGLLNFSEKYLPDQRGGRMDAPLVMSSRIDPSEIDDEAHNIDTMERYPREFYEATRELADPGDVEDVMTIAEETLGTDRQYAGFAHTHDTASLAAGPDLSAYKTLGSMQEKMDAQLNLSRTLRAVDETDVAERIIEYHFLPDLLGNLKAFSSQEFRCLGCGEKYRRAPLSGECRLCGGRVNLTVHEGSVNKYIDTAITVADQFGARPYTKQRLEVLETRINRVFEDDTNKASTLGDYM